MAANIPSSYFYVALCPFQCMAFRSYLLAFWPFNSKRELCKKLFLDVHIHLCLQNFLSNDVVFYGRFVLLDLGHIKAYNRGKNKQKEILIWWFATAKIFNKC